MAKNLYRCTAEIEFYVLSDEDPDDPDLQEYAEEEVSTNGIPEGVWAVKVKSLSDVPDESREVLAWGGTDDRTIAELASEIWPAEKA